MARIFVTRGVIPPALQRLQAGSAASGTTEPSKHEVEVWPEDRPPPREVMLAKAASCDALFTLLTDKIDDALLAAAPRLKVVSNMAVGYDNIDVAACTRRKIVVGHTPGVLTEATADLAFSLLLGAARRIPEALDYTRSGAWRSWQPNLLLGHDLRGATLGIAGFGGIGQAVAHRALAFGMKVLFVSRRPIDFPNAQRAELTTLLEQSDFLSLHLPLSAQTRHYIGRAQLAAMKEGSVLINTARGGIVDQVALLDALDRGRPANAALDVTDPEPPPEGDPILRHPKVMLLPHLGSATVETRARMAMLATENLLCVLEGRPPPHLVNPEVLA